MLGNFSRSVSAGLLLLATAFSLPALAATPTGGTLSPGGQPLSFSGGPFFIPNPSGNAATPVCPAAQLCDDFALKVNAASVAATQTVQIKVSWALAKADFDVYLLDSTGATIIKTSATSSDPETIVLPIPATSTDYILRVVPFVPLGQSYTGTASLVAALPPPGLYVGDAPRFAQYSAPSSFGDGAGEPSFGVDWPVKVAALKHDKVNVGGVGFFQNGSSTFRVSFDDASTPAAATWEDVSTPFVQTFVLSDPIGYTDHQTGRVFSLNLIGGEGNSFMAYSDSDGNTWTPAQGGGVPAGYDHQTLGGGPFPANFALPHPTYPNAVYYCSQEAATATCSLSIDGGQTFLPAIPIYDPSVCLGSIHGHVKVAPNGTVYVPNSSCGTSTGSVGAAISTDGGQTWVDHTVPGSTSALDPSIAIGAKNTVYIGWISGDNHPHAAVSFDGGTNWVNEVDIGTKLGIKAAVFPVMTAGDDDRAAFGFVGTTEGGDFQDKVNFHGVWHFYIATTYDSGTSWVLVDATPDDPVQVGSICVSGTVCSVNRGTNDRNLLDFNDAAVDAQGRIMMGFADGCLPPSCTNASAPPSSKGPYEISRHDHATVLRQTGGRRLFKAFDAPDVLTPAAPALTAVTPAATGGKISLSWTAPDNGGSALTHYNIYRGTTPGGESLLATTPDAQKTTYDDTSIASGTIYYYQISATNANGEGPRSAEMASGVPTAGDLCVPPGQVVTTDAAGDQAILGNNPPVTTGTSGFDITGVAISEAYNGASDKSITFTLKLNSLLSQPTPNSIWKVSWISNDTAGNPQSFFVTFDTTVMPGGQAGYGYTTSSPTGGTLDNSQCDPLGQTACPVIGTYDAANNQIILKLNTSAILPFSDTTGGTSTTASFGAGTVLNAVGAQTQLLIGVAGTGFLQTVDTASGGAYTVKGNAFCRPNTAPVASLFATSTATGPAPLTVAFSASGSSDADGDAIASYRFVYGDGTEETKTVATASHTYSTKGDFPARVQVTDARGKQSTLSPQVLISVTATNHPPVASLSGPTTAVVDQAVTFDASGSTDADGDALTYAFDFGDGTTVAAGPASSASHAFSTTGSHTVTVVVRDPSGASDSKAVSLNVTPAGGGNNPMTASLTADKTDGVTPLTVKLTATAGGQRGNNLSYTFVYGDGRQSAAQTSSINSHVYDTAGTFHPYVIIVDSANHSAVSDHSSATRLQITTHASVVVSPGQETVAQLTLNNGQGSVSGPAPLSVSFDGSRSIAADGTRLTSYTFDFGDGSAKVTGTGAPGMVTHIYTVPGSYTPSLTVTDSANHVSKAQAQAQIGQNPANGTPPAATAPGKTGGGSMEWMTLAAMMGFGLRRRKRG